MHPSLNYKFNLPPEENVLQRNRTITTYYAQLYQNEPNLYKWAGMAAFASFHIGEKLNLWDWDDSGIKPFSFTCEKRSRSIEDDFQIIRIINNKIFTEIGWIHLAFYQLEYDEFKKILIEQKKHSIILNAFEKLQKARLQIKQGEMSVATKKMIWEANTEILWHEQSEVVQPLFDKLSGLFSRAMSLFASFDYKINHRSTRPAERSRFILFMIFNGFRLLKKNWFIPNVTELEQRWYWISKDLLKKWKKVESKQALIHSEITLLAQLEERNLKMTRSH